MDSPLGEKDIHTVSKSLDELCRSDIKSLGLELGLSQRTIDNHPQVLTVDELRHVLISDWINGKDFVTDHGGATWSSLLKGLRDKGHNGIAKKIEELQAGRQYPENSQLSTSTEVGKAINVEEILRKGGVPPQKNIHVERREITARVQKELCSLKDEDGWVVVHGMGGCGKTTLATEAIRSTDVLKAFPGGVFYLTVGEKISIDVILHMIYSLLMFLGEKDYRPVSLEEASTYLRMLKHPRYLLILDDVWSPNVAKNSEFSQCVMVTSRLKDITSSVSHVHHVSVDKGFNKKEGMLLLGAWIGKDPKSLSSHAHSILHSCRGSPFAIALIGALLQKNPHESKLKAISKALVEKSVGEISKYGGVGADYQYETVNASIKLSVKYLPDRLTECFKLLLVLGYNTTIPSNALATVWGVKTYEVDDLVEALIGYSLVQKGSLESEHSDSCHYTVHDLIMDYLHQTIPQQQQATLHKTVINRYSKKCSGDFSSLHADGYIHHRLLSHVKAAGNQVLLGKLMSSLDWLIATILYTDPITVLGNYRNYKSSVSEQVLTKVQSFEIFLSNNLPILSRMQSRDDIVQLALFEADTSDVYQQAAVIARGECTNIPWWNWSNKAVDSGSACVLKVKMHDDWVNHCQYSQDGSCVVSCSFDKTVKLWDSSTGKALQEIREHKSWVLCCALSRTGSYLVSSSYDFTVKVWDVHSKHPLLDFTQHKSWVRCCDFSPNEKLIVSGDAASCVMVWEARTGEVKAKWLIPGSDNYCRQVWSCVFSPSGDCILTGSGNGAIMRWTLKGDPVTQYKGHSACVNVVFNHGGNVMASASYDKTAKIWDVDKSDCVHTLLHSSSVFSCDFSPDDSRLVTGDWGGYVKIWSVKGGDLLQDVEVHSGNVTCVCYSHTGQHILMADYGGLIKILRSEERNEICTNEKQTEQYTSQFSAHFESVRMEHDAVVVCQNKENKELEVVCRCGTAAVVATLGHTPESWRISNTGSMIAVWYWDGLQVTSLTHNENNWEVKELWPGKKPYLGCVKCYFSPDDSKIISCTETEHKSWDASSGKELAAIRVDSQYEILCAFFNDSIRVASAEDKKKHILIWSSVTGEVEHVLSCEDMPEDIPTYGILSIALSQDNSRLIAALQQPGQTVVWKTENWEMVFKVKLKCKFPTCALSPDSSHAAIGSDRDLQIWNISEARKVPVCHRVIGTSDRIRCIVISSDGQEIVTLCGDQIDWWKLDCSHIKTVFLRAKCWKIQVSPDTLTVITIDDSGLLYIITPFIFAKEVSHFSGTMLLASLSAVVTASLFVGLYYNAEGVQFSIGSTVFNHSHST